MCRRMEYVRHSKVTLAPAAGQDAAARAASQGVPKAAALATLVAVAVVREGAWPHPRGWGQGMAPWPLGATVLLAELTRAL
jgi:hypothetical protein